jgi:hypothetical protein
VIATYVRALACALVALALFAGCKKPEDNIGLEVLDPTDALGTVVVDTTTIIAWSRQPDPGVTSGLTRNLLGAYLDPDFGMVRAGIVAQIRLGSTNVGAGSEGQVLDCDSVVLSLAFDANTSGYGNLDAQTFQVFRIAEDLRTDTSYTNAHLPAIIPDDLVADPRGSYVPRPGVKPFIGGDSLAPQIRIRLDNALGEEWLDEQFGRPNFADNTAFLQYFKGLMVLPVDEPQAPYQRGVLYFNLLSADSKVTLYYRNVTGQDTLKVDFPINTSSVRYTVGRFEHDKALRPALPQQLQDSTLGRERIFVQALGGMVGELRFPHVAEYAGLGLRALAKAELVMPVDGPYYPPYGPPAQIFPFRKGADGKDAVLPDQAGSVNLVGGIFDPVAKEYRMVVTQWMQGVLNGEYPNTGLSLVPSSRGVSVNRVILAGPGHATAPMKLRLTFTTY